MKYNRVHNFNAGPAALPLPVLEEIQGALLNFKGSGMSITEISHRSKWFDKVIESAVERTKRLLKIDDSWHVLFIQGGASMQFAMIPMNFLHNDLFGEYVNTGTWSTKAIAETKLQGKKYRVAATSEDKNFCYIPSDIAFDPKATFVHITSNNTIKGTQWHKLPETAGVPLIADMSSDIMSKPVDMANIGMIYAGAQKNIGPAGVTMVILKKDMLSLIPDEAVIPSMLNYKTYASKNSLYNTPPVFGIYTIELVLKWLEDTIGGLEAMMRVNREKAFLLYTLIDNSDFYKGTAEMESRSWMNVTFRLPSEELEAKFVANAKDAGFEGLKGHRSVGGCRASIYNATSLKSVEELITFMELFEKKNRR